jgi:hypothetical protein
MKTTFACITLSVSLAACGVNNLPPMSQTTPLLLSSAGIYKGSTSTRQGATLLMLYDGTAYLFYRSPPQAGQRNVDDVVVVRSGQQSGDGRFKGGNATRYRLVQPGNISPVQVDIDFSRAPAITGVVEAQSDSADRVTFAASPAQMLGQAPTLASATGLYSGRASALRKAVASQIAVTADGLFAGTTTDGCQFRGALAPRGGLNAYDVSATFGAAPCIDANATVSGIAVLDEAQLLMALPKQDRSDVFVFDGVR